MEKHTMHFIKQESTTHPARSVTSELSVSWKTTQVFLEFHGDTAFILGQYVAYIKYIYILNMKVYSLAPAPKLRQQNRS